MSTAQKFNDLQQVARELVQAGAEVRFWTDRAFREQIEAVGASFVDLFDPVSLNEVDDASRPVPSRYVTFAAARGEAVAAAAKAWGAELVVYDSFTTIGEVVGRRLGVPWIAVHTMHLIDAGAIRNALVSDPRVMTDPRCSAAVETLRREYGMTEATPFSYFSDPSPWLNVACEPEQWIDDEQRKRHQPLACFGKLSAATVHRPVPTRPTGRPLRIYASFGTVIWWYWSNQAAAAFEVIATAARDIGARLIIGLGGGVLPAEVRQRLAALGASVLDFADQPHELGQSDVFITHHGAASSHEAIIAGVPMLSFPFNADQPAIAKRCQELGLARPLVAGSARDEMLPPEEVRRSIQDVVMRSRQMQAALSQAREWEIEALAARPTVARRLLAVGT